MFELHIIMTLLQQGFHALRHRGFDEAVTYFIKAREHLSPDHVELASLLDIFLQRNVDYRHVLEELQEISQRLARVTVEQQVSIATLEAMMPLLIQEETNSRPSIDVYHSLLTVRDDPTLLTRTDSVPSSLESNALPVELFVTCFGHFEVRRFGVLIPLCSNTKGQSILHYLIAAPRHNATSDVLQGLLWPEDEPKTALHKLHIAICDLRSSLSKGMPNYAKGGYILCKNHTYALDPTISLHIDVDEFLKFYQQGQRDNVKLVDSYEAACRLYRGPFLWEEIYANWSSSQRDQLALIYLTMCKALLEHYFQAKCYEEATAWAQAILKEDNCDEFAHQKLIQIYTAQRLYHRALQQYQHCEHTLYEELGVQPMYETQLLFRQLFPQ
jgi:DNA-binding SARP family transcriptional activator